MLHELDVTIHVEHYGFPHHLDGLLHEAAHVRVVLFPAPG